MKIAIKSFSVRVALHFMFIMTGAVVLLAFVFLFFTRSLVKKNQTIELKESEQFIFESIESTLRNGDLLKKLPLPKNFIDIPYFLTYIVYEPTEEVLIATNDPFLPLLEDTNGKPKRLFQQDYFFDGNLDIFYYAKTHELSDKKIVVAVAMNMDIDNSMMLFSKLPLALFFLAIPILILSFFVSLFMTKRTIRPVVKITKSAQSVTVENLSALLPISGYDDEIDELSKTFNALFLQLKRDFDRERQFSSDVSHELNTPLTVISGQTGLLLRWGKDDPKQLEKSLLAIKNEAKTMQSIIANLLQISRIESGRVKPQISKVLIENLFSWLVEEFSGIAPNVSINTESNSISLKTDSEMLHQILTVLISNSVKYAGENCHIFLRAYKQDGKLIIEQSDDGPGFTQECLPHIFERFYRADEAHSRKVAGSGLGLSIAQTLCTALNAKIKARNMIPHGAGFTIEF